MGLAGLFRCRVSFHGVCFKVLGYGGYFCVIFGENPSVSVPWILDLLPSQVSAFITPWKLVLSVTSLRVNLGVSVTCGSLGDIGAVGAGLCLGGLSLVLRGPPSFVRKPAQSHSPYGLLFVVPSYGWGHRFASWPTLPHWKHIPMSLSYLYATLTRSPFGLTTWPPLRISFSSGISTWISRKRAWSDASALQSTFTTRPIPRPISSPTSSLMRSKGKPYTWTHIGKLVNRTDLAVKPFSHLCNTNMFFLKLHRPLSHTHCSWLSNENLNWNRPSPTATIFRLLPIFHTDLRRFFAALALNGWVVMNFLMRLREYSSRISSLRAVWMVIGSSSSDVNEMFWIHSTLSLKGNWCKFEFTTAGEQTNYNRDDKSTINSFLDFQINVPGFHVEWIASATQLVLGDS